MPSAAPNPKQPVLESLPQETTWAHSFFSSNCFVFLDPPCQFRSVQSHSFHRRTSVSAKRAISCSKSTQSISDSSTVINHDESHDDHDESFIAAFPLSLAPLFWTSLATSWWRKAWWSWKSAPFWACKEILKHIQIQTWNTWNIRSTWNTICNIQQNLASPFLSMHPKGKSCFALAPWPDETFR